MNTSQLLRRVAAFSLVAVASLSFSACSDDDDLKKSGTDSKSSVFTAGIPTSYNGAAITVNEKGQVASIRSRYDITTFEYGASSSADYSSIMRIRDVDEPEYGSNFYLKLNRSGFITYAYQVEFNDGREEFEGEWWFEYNSDGRMTKMKHNDGGYVETFTMTYAGGDIVKVNYVDEDNETAQYDISYTNDEHSTAVGNKGCVMIFDYALNIDMDEMEIAYYAGLLGKATKHLPMKLTETYDSDEETVTDTSVFRWTFNDNMLPTEFRVGEYGTTITFDW